MITVYYEIFILVLISNGNPPIVFLLPLFLTEGFGKRVTTCFDGRSFHFYSSVLYLRLMPIDLYRQFQHWDFFCFILLQPTNLCDIEQVTRIDVTKEDELSQKLDIQLKDPDKEVCYFLKILQKTTGFQVENPPIFNCWHIEIIHNSRGRKL